MDPPGDDEKFDNACSCFGTKLARDIQTDGRTDGRTTVIKYKKAVPLRCHILI